MTAPAASYLLVRRRGSVWGVADAVVEGRSGGDYRIRSGGAALLADEILDVVDRLRVWPVGSALLRWWPETIAGLAVHGGRPVLVIDPRHPPRALLAEKPKKRSKGRGEA